MSPAIWDHTVSPATRHRWTCPALTPAMQAGTWFTYPGGMEGWVDLGVGYILKWFTCLQTVGHPGSNHLLPTQPGVKLTTFQSWVQCPNHYITTPPLGHQAYLSILGWVTKERPAISTSAFYRLPAFKSPQQLHKCTEDKKVITKYTHNIRKH